METRHYWEENGPAVKYDNYNSGEQLNFAAPHSDEEGEYQGGAYLKKGKQDPMSHRIIEKRRRDRMNNCLADLSRLIPPEYLKKGRGRVEKTEIIEMAIRHLKTLQDRVNAERQAVEDQYRAGYQEAVGEAVRFLVEVQGFGPGDGLCVQLASHLQRHSQHVSNANGLREKSRLHAGSSSETTSSSGSSHGYAVKVIQHPKPPPVFPREPLVPERPLESYHMECDRVVADPVCVEENGVTAQDVAALPLDGPRLKRDQTLRKVRKLDHGEDFLHSYKFKNSIERRFSRSQDNEQAAASQVRGHIHSKLYSHKRRRAAKPATTPSTSTTSTSTTSTSGSTEDTSARDTSPQDTSSESPHQHQYDKPTPTQFVPVFALNSLGKYYVPLSVDYACLTRHLGSYDALDARAVQLSAPLHPVTIHVNFQPCMTYHLKREPTDRDWRSVQMAV
ncbi:transcription factor cwo isoform X3 [Leptidea sinapis]|uniref:transcription factor cwo isoform X3 n=1 Tax=Leptidea sinapis TaxID=189913 RepID=UPI0021C4A549|nr:transcription factor cwo isoform X3 [Leptidea sinapis]